MFEFNDVELQHLARLVFENIKSLKEDLKQCNCDFIGRSEDDEYNRDYIVCSNELDWNEELLKKLDNYYTNNKK